MTKALYEAKENNKQLYIAEHGAHACSYNENKEEYEAAIDQFLNSYVKKQKQACISLFLFAKTSVTCSIFSEIHFIASSNVGNSVV